MEIDWRDRIVEVREERLGDVAGHPQNPKVHPGRQAEALRGVVREIGWAGVPLAYYSERNGGRLTFLDGHLRGAQFPEQQVRVAVTDPNDAEADLFLLTFDPLAQMAEVDKEHAAALFASVEAQDAHVAQLLKGLAALSGVDNLLDDDKHTVDPAYLQDHAAELNEKWQVRLGDVWRVGAHALTCGDCTDPAAWVRVLAAVGAQQANVIFTSPPYAMQRAAQYGGIAADAYVDWWAGVQAPARAHLAADGSFFVNIKAHTEKGQRHLYVHDLVTAMVRQWGWCYVDELIWHKTGLPGGWNNRLRNDFEPVYMFSDGEVAYYATVLDEAEVAPLVGETVGIQHFAAPPGKLKFNPRGAGHRGTHRVYAGGRGENPLTGNITLEAPRKTALVRPGNVIKVSTSSERHAQAAQFPPKLPEFFIKTFSAIGDVILDPFLRAATTIVAAHRNHRRGCGIELLPKGCAVCLERLAVETGATPERIVAGAGDGAR